MNAAVFIAYYPKLTYQRHQRLYRYFPSLNEVWEAKRQDLLNAGWDETIAADFITWREQFDAEKAVTELEREQIRAILLGDSDYPKLLAEIADPPFVLFVRGTLPPSASAAIAVVGTRKCSPYGKQTTADLSHALIEHGVVVISGLALGIDGIAHEVAVNLNRPTVAVLGTGINKKNIYPAAHYDLSERIIATGGALVSEYPPGFEPTQYSFPARNRIVAGLTLGTLVTEAPTESGALITAKCALDYNRDVFVVPHPITSTAGAGGNNLLKQGAKIVTDIQDILEELHLEHVVETITAREMLPTTPTEARILPHVSKEPIHIDALIKLSGLESAAAATAITLMEMKGRIKNIGGMMYILSA